MACVGPITDSQLLANVDRKQTAVASLVAQMTQVKAIAVPQ